MKNFDLFIGIDWSGSKAINTKSIAVATCLQGKEQPQLLQNLRSRTCVANYICDLIKTDQRVLIGIDANFGYYNKVGQKHFGEEYTYLNHWKMVDEYSKDDKNFYAQGFWNNSKFTSDFWQDGKRPDWFDAEKLRRATETQCIKDGYGHPESPFKICYTKQVGKGGLAAQRMAYALKKKLENKIAIWPFEQDDKAQIVLTEIYPRQFLMRAGHGTTKVNDIDSLNKVLPYFNSKIMSKNEIVSDHDTDALVSSAGLRYLCGQDAVIPDAICNPKGMDYNAKVREGWILGVGDKA